MRTRRFAVTAMLLLTLFTTGCTEPSQAISKNMQKTLDLAAVNTNTNNTTTESAQKSESKTESKEPAWKGKHKRHWSELTQEEKRVGHYYVSNNEWNALGNVLNNPWELVYVTEQDSDNPKEYPYLLRETFGIPAIGAHRGTANGEKIMTHPEYVLVDGVAYQYAAETSAQYNFEQQFIFFVSPDPTIDESNGLTLTTCFTDEEMQAIPGYQSGELYEHAFFYKKVE